MCPPLAVVSAISMKTITIQGHVSSHRLCLRIQRDSRSSIRMLSFLFSFKKQIKIKCIARTVALNKNY